VELPHYDNKVLVNGPINHEMHVGVGAVSINPLAQFGKGVDPTPLPAFYSDHWDGRTQVSPTSPRCTRQLVSSEDVEEVGSTSHAIWSQTERRIVESLGADKRTVTFTEPSPTITLSEENEYDGR
jgi:hypothetical protein